MSVPKPALREAITDATLPLGYPATADVHHRWLGLRPWLLTAALFLVPLITYWPATFHDYGLRDDYSNLRESHEEPEWS